MWVLWFSRAFLFERLLTLLHSLISLRTITTEKSLVCRRLYKIFHPFFFGFLDIGMRVFFFVFSCPLIWVASDIHLYCDSFIGTVILWRHYNWEVIGLREGIYLSFLLEKKTPFDALFLLFHTALELVCFLHFESLLFFFFLSDTSLASTDSSAVMPS